MIDSMTAPVLRVRDLTVGYSGRGRRVAAVRGVSFEVGVGEVVAVVGESGSGKTTTANAVIGLLPPAAQVAGGGIELLGEDITNWSDRRMQTVRGARIGYVPQDPTVSLNPSKRIGHQIGDVLRIHGRADRRGAAVRAVEILRLVGLSEPERRVGQYPHELSGGMRQRVLIGMALACDPQLLIADEPTSALDVTVQRRVLDLLADLTARAGTAMLLVTHEQGPAARVLEEPQHPYTRALIAAAPSLSSARLRPAATPGRARLDDGEPVVRVRDLVTDYPAHGRGQALRAVDGVSFDVPRGTTFALVGESGSGKSTVARTVARLVDAGSGTVELFGRDVTRLRGAELRALRARVQIVHQNPYAALNPRLSVREILVDPLRAYRIGDRIARRRAADELLDDVALPRALGDRRPAELSGGQRQRVAIARALALRPDLVVLDEPVSALDVSVQAQVLALLVELQARHDLTYLLVSHDLAVVRQVSDQVGVMATGRLVEVGPTEAVFGSPTAEHTRALLDAIPKPRAAPASAASHRPLSERTYR
jgi:peptide/nickel transport system ATP-binding protein